jgi:hypothetical protein
LQGPDERPVAGQGLLCLNSAFAETRTLEPSLTITGTSRTP